LRQTRVMAALAVLALIWSGARVEAGLSSKAWKRLQATSISQLSSGDFGALAGSMTQLGEDDSARAVKWIEKLLRKVEGDATVFAAASQAFDGMHAKAALKAQRSLALKSKDWRIRVLFIDTLGKRAATGDIDVLIKAIKDKNAVAATTAIRRLCARREEAAMEPLVALMEKLDAKRTPPWAELRMSLGELMGRTLESGADYRSWWLVLKERGGLASVTDEDRERDRQAKRRDSGELSTSVRLFGSEILCTRLVFVLDTSGSMQTIDPGDGRPGGTSSVPQGEPDPSRPDPRLRIERAKRELKRVVGVLPDSTEINIIAYSSSVHAWKETGLHKLSSKNRADAIAFIEEFRADGVTATDQALRVALEVEGTRCIYLLSDGKPSMGEGEDIPHGTIYDLVEAKNKLLKVRIFSLGFSGADQSFMRELARRTGGRYSDIR